MGGLQAILSLTLIIGPVVAGLGFDHLGAPAPYWIGALLATLALLAASGALLRERRTTPTAGDFAGLASYGSDTSSKQRETRG
jgi:MFS family permease